jgi:hypothetical protein
VLPIDSVRGICCDVFHACTVSCPDIDGWIAHTNEKLPGVVGATMLTTPPVSTTPLSKDPSVAVTVCSTPSRLLTVTAAPGDTVTALNVNWEIVIAGGAPGTAAVAAAAGLGAGSGLMSRTVAVNAAAVTQTMSEPVIFMKVPTSSTSDRFDKFGTDLVFTS